MPPLSKETYGSVIYVGSSCFSNADFLFFYEYVRRNSFTDSPYFFLKLFNMTNIKRDINMRNISK